MAADILFKTDEWVFSYRVAGLIVQDGKVLLQKPVNDDGYSVPGGHLNFGETAAQALAREFLEEIGASVQVGRLLAAGEVYFPWGERPCHQIGLYFEAALLEEGQIPLEGAFRAVDELGGERIDLIFAWIPLAELDAITVYPPQIKDALRAPGDGAAHFVYKATGMQFTSA